MTLESINPATGEPVETYPGLAASEITTAIDEAHRAFSAWHRLGFAERASHLLAAAEILRGRAGRYASLMATEMGKPVTEGRAEVDKCAWACEYYASNAERFLEPESVATEAAESFVTFQPLGVVLAIMPWNFPFWQVFRAAAPSLMAGNAMLLKHASNVPGCALAIEAVFRDAGVPDGVFRSLLIGSGQVARIIEDARIRAATLTGSTPAGRAVASRAGQSLKKVVLELGGSDPYVILEDADLETAVEVCVASRLINTGQSCIAAKRFVVVEPIHGEFERRFVDRMAAARMGDPHDETTDLGPLARFDLRDQLHRQVRRSVDAGARCVLGGAIPDAPGAFYPPTVLTDVGPGMPAYDEELFGPVAAIIRARDHEHAIEVANDSRFGLGAAVFTRDTARGIDIATTRLDAGSCFVNTHVRSDPRLPFGGVKESGFGRELSHYGIKEFVNIKTVCVA